MYLVFDIGGTNMRVAVSSDGKTLLRSKIIPTGSNFQASLSLLKQTALSLSEGEKFNKVAGGVAVVFDKEKNIAVKTAHLQDFVGRSLRDEFERAFESPVKLENDTALGGLGEAVYGAGKGSEIVAYIPIGTGIGGVRIVNDQIDAKSFGFEPGHQIIYPDGNLCGCGGKGHWEAYVAGGYLEKIYNQKGEDIKDPAIWDQIAENLSLGLHNTIVHWSPDLVILGGSVTESIPLIKVQEYLKKYLTIFPEVPAIKKAILGDDAGLYGALTLAAYIPSNQV